jgi:UDP-glucose 4-epimerase
MAHHNAGREARFMRVIITGSSGLIGTSLALRLIADGTEVLGVDRSPNPWTDAIPTQIEDLCSTVPPESHPWGRADVVVHLAARAKVHESVERPLNALENYTVTHRVLEFCRANGTPVIYGSSREVYGEQAVVPVAEDTVRLEGAASPYAAAKLADEALIRSFGRCFSLPFIIIRFSNVYGRFDDLERNGRFIPLLCDRVPRGDPMTIFGPSKSFDFTYIDDAVEGVSRAITKLATAPESVSGNAINLGTGNGTSLLEAANLVAKAAGVIPNFTLGTIRVGEISRYVADLTKARTLLGYEPQYPATRGIPLAYQWWRSWHHAEQK